MSCGLRNTLGGDGDARYDKYSIHWSGQILTLSIMKLKQILSNKTPDGRCLGVVVPSYRCNNLDILRRIMNLRSSIHMNVKFWIVIDNTNPDHLKEVKFLAEETIAIQKDGNYYINVIHYGENRGANNARNVGYNYSSADWILFLDDDVVPSKHILDAYAGAIIRHPDARVFVGDTALPPPCNNWTEILNTSNAMYFYGISRHRVHPPWGVTANLLVRGSRHNHIVQFNNVYPKTGGGEDIDFVFQLKEWYGRDMNPMQVVVGVEGARVEHPWWRKGKVCYRQIMGWAWGDSLCVTEWPEKTYFCLPNWIESILFILTVVAYFTDNYQGALWSALLVVIFDHAVKAFILFPTVLKRCKSFPRAMFITVGATSVISSQEVTRVAVLFYRRDILSFCRRMDWIDGQATTQVLDIQLRSAVSGELSYLYPGSNVLL